MWLMNIYHYTASDEKLGCLKGQPQILILLISPQLETVGKVWERGWDITYPWKNFILESKSVQFWKIHCCTMCGKIISYNIFASTWHGTLHSHFASYYYEVLHVWLLWKPLVSNVFLLYHHIGGCRYKHLRVENTYSNYKLPSIPK